MKRFRRLALPVLALAGFLAGAATPRDQVPPVFKSLVPPGCERTSAQFTKSGSDEIVMLGTNFTCYQAYKGQHHVYDGEHSFDLNLQQGPSDYIAMQGRRYRQVFPAEIDKARRTYQTSEPSPVVAYDSYKETEYPWGWGMTRRILHKWMGAGSKPDDIDYEGYYLGLIVGDTSIKRFKLHVFGVKTKEEVERWAAQAADLIQKNSAADIN